MKSKALLIGILTFTVVLAGCIGDGGEVEGDGSETGDQPVDLGNQGAIRGLVVDDNFRPVQLKEEWSQTPGEFQDVGFVLVLETGQRFETNENGEFVVLPLEPGTYTVRVAADVHEAKDQTVTVVSGEYSEVTVEARRQYSGGGTVLSQEEVIFIACSATAVAVSVATLPGGCGDISGDSERFDFWSDFRPLKDDVRGIVTEMRASQEGYYAVNIRVIEDWCAQTFNQCYYAEAEVAEGNYVHNVLYPQRQYVSPGEYLEEGQEGYCMVEEDDCRTYGFSLDYEIQTALFPEPSSRYFTDQVYEVSPVTWGPAGVILGTKAQFLQNVFLYELPESGIEDFCALCEDADIPE